MRKSSSAALKTEYQATIFAALGDATRLSLVAKLIDGKPHSISTLASDTHITRQAITKHLRVLEDVGIVTNLKSGRESLYELDTKPLESVQKYLAVISDEWDRSLNRLKAFVENNLK